MNVLRYLDREFIDPVDGVRAWKGGGVATHDLFQNLS